MVDRETYISENSAIEILQDVKVRHAKIEALKDQLVEIESAMKSISATKLTADKVQSSHNQNGLDDQIIRLFDVQAKTTATIIEYLELNSYLVSILCNIDNALYIEILTKRYFRFEDDGKQSKWETIAKELDYNTVHIQKQNNFAVDAFQQAIYETLNEAIKSY